MTTVANLIDLAFRDSGVLGVGQTAQAQDTTDALRRLNQMISQWQIRRWLVYHLIDSSVACDGSTYYTVGSGGQINIQRPDKLEYAFIRQTVSSSPNQIDWPLEILTAYEDYARIEIKGLAAAPSSYLFYDSGYPLGKIYPWPLPNSQYSVHILTKAVLQAFATTADTVLLPPEYEDVIYLNLALRLRMAYRLTADPVLTGLAKAALNTIRMANFQIRRLRMPRSVVGGPAYNIYSDRGV